MPKEQSPGKPTTRRYTDAEKAQAVRLVRQARVKRRGVVCEASVSTVISSAVS